MPTFRHLADNTTGLAGDDAEARYNHVGRYDGAVEDADVVLDNGELANYDVRADVYVASDRGGLDDGGFTDEYVIA